jgi:hypothetical protein
MRPAVLAVLLQSLRYAEHRWRCALAAASSLDPALDPWPCPEPLAGAYLLSIDSVSGTKPHADERRAGLRAVYVVTYALAFGFAFSRRAFFARLLYFALWLFPMILIRSAREVSPSKVPGRRVTRRATREPSAEPRRERERRESRDARHARRAARV